MFLRLNILTISFLSVSVLPLSRSTSNELMKLRIYFFYNNNYSNHNSTQGLGGMGNVGAGSRADTNALGGRGEKEQQ